MTDRDQPAEELETSPGAELSEEEQIWKELAEADPTPADSLRERGDAFRAVEDDDPPDDPDEREEADTTTDEDGDDGQDDEDGAGSDDTSDADPIARLKELQDLNESLEAKLNREKGRSAGQQRRADRLQQELERLRNRAAERTEDDDEAKEAHKQKMESIANEYGDVVGPLIEEMNSLKSRQDELSAVDAKRLEDTEQELRDLEQAEYDKVLENHADGFKVIQENSDAFKSWIEDQPKRYRDIFESNRKTLVDGTGAALIISRFKSALLEADQSEGDPPAKTEQKQPLTGRRQRQLEGARTTRTGSRNNAVTDVPPPDSNDEEAHWNYWRMQDEKKARRG